MQQPIPKKITENNPDFAKRTFNTLLIDGSNLLEVCFRADRRISSNGRNTGAIYQFFLQLKLLFRKGNFRYCYVFFDGDNSGELRYRECVDYKANRDKTFSNDDLSDYMRQFNETIRRWTAKASGGKERMNETEKENFFWQRDMVISMCEELCIRTMAADKTEADDLIAWYVLNKKPEERIVICTNDRDMTQLIHRSDKDGKDDVIIYMQRIHDFVNSKNHKDKTGIHYENVLLYKVLCGDNSDNIKGVKGLGSTTLLKNFPEIADRKVSIEDVVEKARNINEQRAKEKKKPLLWASNVVNGVTDGCQGSHLYEINTKIIDLRNPLMSDDAKELVESFMYAPMDTDDRTMGNLYAIVTAAGIDEWRDEGAFGNFFAEFGTLIDKERRNSEC